MSLAVDHLPSATKRVKSNVESVHDIHDIKKSKRRRRSINENNNNVPGADHVKKPTTHVHVNRSNRTRVDENCRDNVENVVAVDESVGQKQSVNTAHDHDGRLGDCRSCDIMDDDFDYVSDKVKPKSNAERNARYHMKRKAHDIEAYKRERRAGQLKYRQNLPEFRRQEVLMKSASWRRANVPHIAHYRLLLQGINCVQRAMATDKTMYSHLKSCMSTNMLKTIKKYADGVRIARAARNQKQLARCRAKLVTIVKHLNQPTVKHRWNRKECYMLSVMDKICESNPADKTVQTKLQLHQSVFNNVDNFRKITIDLIEAEINFMVAQLTKDILRPAVRTDDDYEKSRLCRMSYHILPRNSEPDERYQTMDEYFPVLFEDQFGRADKNPSDEPHDAYDSELAQKETNAIGKYVAEMLAENIGQSEIRGEDKTIKEITKIVERKCTYIRACDASCPVLTAVVAIQIKENLLALSLKSPEFMIECDVLPVVEELNLIEIIKKYMPCFAGLRSLYKRLITTLALIKFRMRVDFAVSSGDDTELTRILNFHKIPGLVEKRIGAIDFKIDETTMTERRARRQYKACIKAFQKDIQSFEIYPCSICLRLRTPDDCVRYDKGEVNKVILDSLEVPDVFYGCRSCMRAVRKGNIPPYAVVNLNYLDDIPAELRELTWIELQCILIMRPVINVVTLLDKRGKNTGIPATRGAMVLLKVPIEGTMTYVADTLPSATNLQIIVHHGVRLQVVRLAKVFAALEWLKKNNIHYHHIKIDRRFKFVAGKHVIFLDEDATQEDADKLMKEGTMLLQRDYEFQPLLPNVIHGPQGLAGEQYDLIRLKYEPMHVNKPFLDCKAFPQLFPKGDFGFNAARPVDLSVRMCMRRWLLHADRRFVECRFFVCFMHGLLQQMDIHASMGIASRMSMKDLTAGRILEQLSNKDPKFTMCTSARFAGLRGISTYWEAVGHDLRAHVDHFGAPTWFMTLNPNEADWIEVHALYSKAYNTPVDATNVRQFIVKDPVLWSRHFQQRIRAVMKNVVYNKKGPFGEVLHSFVRIEYQARGTQHLHILLWCKNAPKTTDSDETVAAYIDSIATARLPDRETEPNAYALVDRLQRHCQTHTPTCLRFYRYKGDICQRCRFEFPRPASGTTRLLTQKEMAASPTESRKFYNLKRRTCDQFINDYCMPVLLAWKGNMDIQCVKCNVSGVLNYVTGYTTKGETASDKHLLKDLRNTEVKNGDLFKIFLELLNMRDIGMLEMCDLILGHNLYQFDVGHVFVNTNAKEKRLRMAVPSEALKVKGHDEAGYVDNLPDVYYPGRSKHLDHACLYNVVLNFDVRTVDKLKGYHLAEDGNRNLFGEVIPGTVNVVEELIDAEDNNNEAPPDEDEEAVRNATAYSYRQNNPFEHEYHIYDRYSPFYCYPAYGKSVSVDCNSEGRAFVKRRANVPRFFFSKMDVTDEVNREDYYRRLCMLFIPWRDEDKLRGDYELYETHWCAYMVTLKAEHPEAHADIQTLIGHVSEMLAVDRESYRRRREMKQVFEQEDIVEEEENMLNVFHREVNADEQLKQIASLNPAQLEIYQDVTDVIARQVAGDTTVCPIARFVGGTAGVGKSHLIKTIADQLTLSYTTNNEAAIYPAVLLAAPTALAAIQIGGATIHSLFSLEVQHGRNKHFNPLNSMKLTAKRVLFRNVKLIIIDEISMVSNINLTAVHCRLTQICGNQLMFGGINVLVFGDLLQLKPVCAPRVFEDLESRQLRGYFDSAVPSFNLWMQFDYRELTENMRQRDDLKFAEIMGRLRTQTLTAEDVTMLKNRVIQIEGVERPSMAHIASFFLTLHAVDSKVMALFPKRDQCDDFNIEFANLLKLNLIEIPAHDTEVRRTTQKQMKGRYTRPYQRREFNLELSKHDLKREAPILRANARLNDQRAGGLPQSIMLAIGCRVMLRRNLKPSNGLVNGATGFLRDIEFLNPNDVTSAEALIIEFDHLTECVRIEKVCAMFNVGVDETVTRRQFPVIVAFAATIHKSQGLTLSNVLIETKSIFSAGQAFVAMSRVRNIESLHLVNFEYHRCYADYLSMQEYNRLRQTIKLPLFPLPRKPHEDEDYDEKHPLQIILPHIVTQAKKSAKQQKPSKMVVVPPPVDQEGSLPLINGGSDCFLIAAVNLLYAAKEVVKRVVAETYNDHGFQYRLALQFMRTTDNVVSLRSTLEDRFHVGDQDAEECLFSMVTNLSRDVKELFYFTVERAVKCQCTNNMFTTTSTTTNNLQYMLSLSKDFLASKVVDFPVAVSTSLQNKVTTCKRCHGERIRRQTCSSPRSQKYLLMGIRQPTESFENHIEIRKHHPSNISLIGKRWEFVGAIEYIPSRTHYIALIRQEVGYVEVDNTVVTPRFQTKAGLKGYTVCLYERKTW